MLMVQRHPRTARSKVRERQESGTEAEHEELFPRPKRLRRIFVSRLAVRNCMRRPRGIGKSSGGSSTGLKWSVVRAVYAGHFENLGASTSIYAIGGRAIRERG